MKKLLLSLTALSLLFTAAACTSTQKYRTDIAAKELADTLSAELPVDRGYVYYEDDQLDFFLDDETLNTEHCAVYSLLSENIDEFGVFRAESKKQANDIADDCRDYLEDKYEDEQAFIASYAPNEVPKLENAEVRVFGNYTVYAVLSDEGRSALFSKVEEILKSS